MTRSGRTLAGCVAALFLTAALAPPHASARQEAGTIRGVVTGAAGQPVGGARVVVGGAGRAVAGAALTDAAGRFAVEGLRAGGSYTLSVSRAGYATRTIGDLRAAPGEGLRLAVTLDVEPFVLPEVRVMGVAPGVLETIPGSTHLIDERTLRVSRPLSASEVLRRVSGVHVKEEDALGLNLNIGVRGLNPRRSSRVLLLEDGVPIHLAPYGDPSAHYQPPVEGLERIEVLKGSGQILHGPQTVGGVINYVRAAPPATPGGSLSLTRGTQGLLGGHASLGGRWQGVGAGVDYIRREADGPRDLWRQRVDDLTARALLGTGPGRSLTLKGTLYQEDSRYGESGLTQGEFEADPRGNPSPNDVFHLRRYALQGVHRWEVAGDATLTTSLYGQHLHRESWRQASDSGHRFGTGRYAERFNCRAGAVGVGECGNEGRPRTYRFVGAEPRLSLVRRVLGVESHLDVGARAHLELAERRQYLGEHASARTGTRVRDNAIRTDAYSVFLQNRVVLGALTLSPGVRLEQVRSRNSNRMQESRQEDAYAEWLPGLGIAYTGLAGTTLFAGAHRGFAPPRPADVLSPQPGEGLVQVDPELSWNHEAGVRSEPLPGLSAEATLFRIDFANQIVEGRLAGAGQRFVNGGRTVHQGVEAGAALELGTLRGSAHNPFAEVAYTHLARAAFASDLLSSIDRGTPVLGNRLPYAPRHMLNATAGYGHASGFLLRLEADHVSEQFSDDLNSRTPSADGQTGLLPAYTLYALSVEQALPARGVTLYLTGKNLQDTVYITERQYGIMVGMPRTLAAGARWSF
jgi:Fe(3+) dicitrate transport protein